MAQYLKNIRDLSIELTDPATPDTTATLLLREFKTEPFMFKSERYGQGKLWPSIKRAVMASSLEPGLIIYIFMYKIINYSVPVGTESYFEVFTEVW